MHSQYNLFYIDKDILKKLFLEQNISMETSVLGSEF